MPADPKHPLFGRRNSETGTLNIETGEVKMHRTPEDVRRVRSELEQARQYVANAEKLGQDYAYFQSAQSANRSLKQARKALDDALRAM